MTSFFIVRHGNTFSPGEVSLRIGCATDLPLTETGERQAKTLGESFVAKGIAFDRSFAGSLARTRRTADLILACQHPAPPLEAADWLTEIDHGEDEGKPEELVAARVGAAALRAWDEQGTAPPGWHVGGETRIKSWRRLFSGERRDNVLLVTSNGAARFALLACSTPRPLSLKLRTGAFGRISRSSSGALVVVEWNVRP